MDNFIPEKSKWPRRSLTRQQMSDEMFKKLIEEMSLPPEKNVEPIVNQTKNMN